MSNHAKYRAMERFIDTDKIKKTISNPTTKVNQFEGRIKVEKKIDGRNITVIYKKEKGKFVIITII
ncbi:MAG: DUF4258 domain-containing protein [Parcubacteria group bacterium]|nr:DUF4258 domain-containing protein [Parcubacteria group bacterium]